MDSTTDWFLKLLHFLLLFCGAFVLAVMVQAGFELLLGNSLSSGLNLDSLAENVNGYKLVQLLSTLIMFVLPVMTYRQLHPEDDGYTELRKSVFPWPICLTILFTLLSLPVIGWLAQWNAGLSLPSFLSEVEDVMRVMEEDALEMLLVLLDMNHIGDLLINLIVVAAAPALFEELFFRGGLQSILHKGMNIHVAIFITAFIFSFIHFQFFGFFPRLLMGIYLGYLFYYSGNLWYPILAHFLNNGLQVIFMYAGLMSGETGEELPGTDWQIAVTALACTVLMMGVIILFRNWFSDDREASEYGTTSHLPKKTN